jgi:hypothetical protein
VCRSRGGGPATRFAARARVRPPPFPTRPRNVVSIESYGRLEPYVSGRFARLVAAIARGPSPAFAPHGFPRVRGRERAGSWALGPERSRGGALTFLVGWGIVGRWGEGWRSRPNRSWPGSPATATRSSGRADCWPSPGPTCRIRGPLGPPAPPPRPRPCSPLPRGRRLRHPPRRQLRLRPLPLPRRCFPKRGRLRRRRPPPSRRRSRARPSNLGSRRQPPSPPPRPQE